MTWLAGIRAFEDVIASFEAWRDAMRGWGMEFLDDGQLRHGDREIGRWERAGGDPLDDSACSFVGPRIAAVSLHTYDWAIDRDLRHELMCGVFKEGRDAVLHVETGRQWQAVGRKQRAVADCLGKYALDDGAELLTRDDGPYASWTVDAVRAALGDHGGSAGWMSTSHNPLRFYGDGNLRNLEAPVSLWLFDFDNLRAIVDDDELWQ